MPANDGVGLHPQQKPFEVVIDAAAVIHPRARRRIGKLYRSRRIDERPPLSSLLIVHLGSGRSYRLAKIFWRPKAAARGQNFSEIFRQAFIDPKQIAVHWLLEIRSRQIRGPSILAIPRVGVFMAQQIAEID